MKETTFSIVGRLWEMFIFNYRTKEDGGTTWSGSGWIKGCGNLYEIYAPRNEKELE